MITITDLEQDKELDRAALREITGGFNRRLHLFSLDRKTILGPSQRTLTKKEERRRRYPLKPNVFGRNIRFV